MKRPLSAEQLAALYDESKEKLPKSERARWLDDRLAAQVSFAYEKAPAVKAKFDKAGVAPSDIKTVKDLEKLPVTTKDELVKLQAQDPPLGGFLAVPLNSLSRVYVSPGPIYDAWGDERVMAAVRGMVRSGWPKPGDVCLVANMYHMVPAGLFITDVLDMIGCTVVPAGIGQTELQVKLLKDLQVSAIFSFPSFVMTILQKAEEMGYDVKKDFNIKYVTGGGERHIQVLRKVFEEKYGLIVGDGYGTADLGTVAYDCGRGEGYHYDDNECVVEIVDPDTGKQVEPMEVGEVVVTLLSNVYPLVRFGTGDLASYVDETCACGRSSPRITKILGMVGEHVRVKGMFVHLRELDEAMSKFQNISKYQLVLKLEGHKDQVQLNVEADDVPDKNQFAEQISARCQDVFKLRMDDVQFLPKGTLPEDYKKFVDTRWG